MEIGRAICAWYNINKRDLPWRHITDAYTIWVSEIIMQQTRINQGMAYYLNFISQFPTVFDLAKADENQVLMVWQGLGYYSRARNMHYTAKEIVNLNNGKFPDNSTDLLKLKGIGKYTAAAISSICNNENIAAIDGNVIRVIARLYNIKDDVTKNSTQNLIEKISAELVKNTDAAIYNQAMMDLGATIFLPKNPQCSICPLVTTCLASKNKTIGGIPMKEKKTASKMRYIAYLVLKSAKHTLITKRSGNDIWKGLHEFPLIEFDKQTPINEILNHPKIAHYTNGNAASVQLIEVGAHKLSHQTIHAVFVIITLDKLPQINDYQLIEINNIHLHPFPRLIEKQLEKIFY
jgi:A/G-specific adenine glycosylase